jgi:hypothetical protein
MRKYQFFLLGKIVLVIIKKIIIIIIIIITIIITIIIIIINIHVNYILFSSTISAVLFLNFFAYLASETLLIVHIIITK